MKTFIKLFILGLLLFPSCAFAQTQKMSKKFTGEFEWNFIGDYTFSGFRKENGEGVFDGSFQMVAKIDEKFNTYKRRYTATLKGSYTLKGSHSMGKLHGPMSLDANLNLNASNGDKLNNKYTFRGNFKNGNPDGNFIVDYPSYGIKVNVNYKDGILVGAYYVKGRDERSWNFSISGTLTSTGLPTGTWKFDTSSVYEMTFINGVVVNQSDYDYDLSVKAKDFASGKVSEEDLMKENICVIERNLALATKASLQIYHKGIDWSKLGLRRFNLSDTINYRCLDRLSTLSEEGYNKFKDAVREAIRTREKDSYKFVRQAYYYATSFHEHIDKERNNLSYANINRVDLVDLKPYVVGYPNWDSGVVRVYFTQEQVDEISQVIHESYLAQLDSISVSQIEKENSRYGSLYKDFKPHESNSNILIYQSGTYKYYVSSDAYEDYYIQNGKGAEILEILPADRHDIIKSKIKEFYDGLLMKVCDKFNSYSKHDQWRKIAGDSNAYMLEYKAVGNVERNNGGYILPSTVKIATKTSDDSANNCIRYKTFSFNVYFTYSNGTITISQESLYSQYFKRIKNEFDIIDELDLTIQQNNSKIAAEATDVYELFTTYQNSLDFTIHNGKLESAIKSRENFILLQNDVFKFIELRTTINNNHVNITDLKSTAPAIYKAYITYYSKYNPEWSPNVDFEKINALIDIQNRYYGTFDGNNHTISR